MIINSKIYAMKRNFKDSQFAGHRSKRKRKQALSKQAREEKRQEAIGKKFKLNNYSNTLIEM